MGGRGGLSSPQGGYLARRWGVLKGNSWRHTGGTWLLPRLQRGGRGEGGLGRTLGVFEISRARWVKMKHPPWDSPG